jgi:hypothetical protein
MSNVSIRMRRSVSRLGHAIPPIKNKYLRTAVWFAGLILVVILAGFAYAFASSPAMIRNPQFEHLHFRMQVITDGKAVNFADKKFQEGYSKDNCNADLTLSPIHFHDNKDQFVHIHWKDITGGQVLKFYGWNYIGGVDGLLGYRFDNFPALKTVPTHGNQLPGVPKDAKFYMYSGDERAYTERRFEDFKTKSLEDFFGQQSNVVRDETSLLDTLFPRASAHAAHEHDSSPNNTVAPTEETLKRINNLIGNVVLFVQEDKPTDAQIKARFDALEPLSESSCAG